MYENISAIEHTSVGLAHARPNKYCKKIVLIMFVGIFGGLYLINSEFVNMPQHIILWFYTMIFLIQCFNYILMKIIPKCN